MTEKINWNACWVCKRTKEDIERLFDISNDVDYFEEHNWVNYNGINFCPVCNDLLNYLFWIRLNAYFSSISEFINEKSPIEFWELWKKGDKKVGR